MFEIWKIIAREIQMNAEEEIPAPCIEGEVVFFLKFFEALIPGHIYSNAGIDEYHISRTCEYHFDDWFKEDDRDCCPASYQGEVS